MANDETRMTNQFPSQNAQAGHPEGWRSGRRVEPDNPGLHSAPEPFAPGLTETECFVIQAFVIGSTFGLRYSPLDHPAPRNWDKNLSHWQVARPVEQCVGQ